MFERFTAAARAAIVVAQQHARDHDHSEIGALDVLVGVLRDDTGGTVRVLTDAGVDPSALERAAGAGSPNPDADAEALAAMGIDLTEVRRRTEETFGPGALDRPRRQRAGLFGRRGGGHLPMSAEAKSSLELALGASVEQGHGYLGSEHIFLGLLATPQGTLRTLLRRHGLSVDEPTLRRLVLAQLSAAA